MAAVSRDHQLLAHACAALQPYQWRRLRPEWIARLLLTAKDRHELTGLLAHVPGADVGPWDDPGPVDREDPRLAVLVQFLRSQRWTELRLTTLCGHLLALLDDARPVPRPPGPI